MKIPVMKKYILGHSKMEQVHDEFALEHMAIWRSQSLPFILPLTDGFWLESMHCAVVFQRFEGIGWSIIEFIDLQLNCHMSR